MAKISKVYVFGCKVPPREDLERIQSQSALARDYQNELIEAARAKRRAQEELIGRSSTEYQAALGEESALEQQIDCLYEELARERQRKRKRLMPEQVLEEIRGLRQKLRGVWETKRQARKVFFAEHITPRDKEIKERFAEVVSAEDAATNNWKKRTLRAKLMDELRPTYSPVYAAWVRINEEHTQSEEAARQKAKQAGLTDGTKELVEAAVEQAVARAQKTGARINLKRDLPNVGIRIRDDASHDPAVVAADGTVKHEKFQLTPQPAPANDHRDPNSKRSKLRRRMIATVRLGPGLTVSVPVLVHRELPKDAVIKYVILQQERIGLRVHYQLLLTLQGENLGGRAPARRIDQVTVRLGWAELPAEADKTPAIATGRWEGSDGQTGIIELESATNHALLNAETLRSHQDTHHNEALEVLRSWPNLPEWVKEGIKDSQHWRSPRHLATIVYRLTSESGGPWKELWAAWKADCRELGADFFQPIDAMRLWLAQRDITDPLKVLAIYLEWWRIKNRHLYRYEANHRARALRRRIDRYRVESHHLAARYERVVILEPIALVRAARKKRADQPIEGPEQRWTGQRRRAAPSALKLALANAFGVKAKDVVQGIRETEDTNAESAKAPKTRAKRATQADASPGA